SALRKIRTSALDRDRKLHVCELRAHRLSNERRGRAAGMRDVGNGSHGNLEAARMSRYTRNRRRRRDHGTARLLLVGGGVSLGVLLAAVLGVVIYVLHVADSAPALSSLHPV